MADQSELEALRTQVANQAASLAETVTQGFEDFTMGAAHWSVQLSTPDGPSTGGGAQALQHLRLVPKRKGYATIVAGTVDPVRNAGEIRTFEHVAVHHEVRFGRPLEIMPDEYDSFLAKAEVVFNLARVRLTRSPPTAELLAAKKAKKKLSMPALAFFIVVVMVAAAVVYRVAKVLHH